MIRTSIFLGLIAVCTSLSSLAQHAYFPTKGIITFEKEVYVRARMREMTNNMEKQNRGMMMRFGGNINDIPEKTSSFFNLHFDEDETLMLAVEESNKSTGTSGSATITRSTGSGRGGQSGSMQMSTSSGANIRVSSGGFGHASRKSDKIIYQNLKQQISEVAMELDDKIILKDSLQPITWRFTNEYRNIAGYECRRVNGATADSLYVIAFYTDQIPLSAGPALVNGLPGMVLGLAIPEMHINYWARSIAFTVDNVPSDWRDKKSKAMSMQEFLTTLGNNRMFGGGGNTGASQIKRNIMENLIY